MIQECERCRELLSERMPRFDSVRKVRGGVPLLRDHIVDQGELLFPRAFELLFNPHQWTADTIPNFPVLSHDQTRMCFTFHVVNAPLPFAAACVRITCDQCGLSHRPVVLNAMLIVLASHLTAAGLGTGLNPRRLSEFFRALHSDAGSINEFAAPDSVPRAEIFAGALWLAFHEFGHIVGNSLVGPEQVEGPESSRVTIAGELNADLAAFRVLHHRTIANRPMLDNFPVLLCGVEIILRTIAAMSGFDGRPRLLRETKSQVILTHPSPWQRWSVIRAYAAIDFKLGSGDRSFYLNHRKRLLGNFNRAINTMRLAEHFDAAN
ncbi:hypothetical protein [Methylobacterium sp. Leaf469]|uniref:hypothetical protein n=1 Tax=Methylobacterium sp. Leaf469 TaxID=1736387 RepID=UPI000AC28884|nr:hypothetical protein [Methylobacterium sp. Leaf469]